MSTKIYNGYRLKGQSLEGALAIVRAFQEGLLQAVEERRHKLAAHYIVGELDARRLGRRSPLQITEDESLTWVVSDLFREPRPRRGQEEPPVSRTWAAEDCQDTCAILLYPNKDGALAQIFTSVREFEDRWRAHPGVQDYHYQNQTDQPSNISTRAWNKRGLDWEQAFTVGNRSWVGAKYAGLTCELVEPMLIGLKLEEIMAQQPSRADRVRRWVEDIAGDRWCREERERNPPAQEERGAEVSMQIYQRWRKFARTEEGQKFLETIRGQIAERLPEHWTVEDVKGFRPLPTEPEQPSTKRSGVAR